MLTTNKTKHPLKVALCGILATVVIGLLACAPASGPSLATSQPAPTVAPTATWDTPHGDASPQEATTPGDTGQDDASGQGGHDHAHDNHEGLDHEHPLAQEGEPSDLPDPFEDEEDIPELEDDDFPELDDQNELELDDETPTDATSTAADFSGLTVEELISATQDQDWGVRWDAVNELGVRKDIRGVPSLVDRALYDENPHPQWRALWALSAVDPTGAETVPYFLDALEDPDPLVVHYAALGLAFFDRPEARPALLQGTKHADSYRRWESVFSLRTVGSTEVAEAIIPLLDPEFEPDDGVRGEVALALGDMGDMGDEQAVAALLGALENDPNTSVRWRAAMALGSKRDPSLVAKLEAVLTSETDPQVRESTEEAISRLSGT